MATRREVRRAVGQFRIAKRKLLEVYGTATGVGSGTVDLGELALYAGGQATDFDGFGVSSITDGTDGFVTTYTSGSNRLTFIPATTPTASAVVEVWQPTFNATIINNYIDAAIDTVRDEVLQEWGTTSYAVGYSTEQEMFLPRTPKFIYGVRVGNAAPATGWGRTNLTVFEPLFNTSARTQLSQGFQVTSDTYVRGVSLYLNKQGTISTARTLTANIETNTAGAPSTTEVTGATATLSSDFISSNPRWCFFDFGKPVLLTASTTYHITLAISSTADSSNYIQWGKDGAGDYSGGYYNRATDAGTSWVSDTASDLLFHVIPWFSEWTDLYDHEWELYKDTDSTHIRLLFQGGVELPVSDLGYYPTYSEGCPVQLLGLERADRPTSDTAEMEVSRAYLESQVMAYIMRDLGLREEAAFWARQAERELQMHPVLTRLPSGSRKVFISG